MNPQAQLQRGQRNSRTRKISLEMVSSKEERTERKELFNIVLAFNNTIKGMQLTVSEAKAMFNGRTTNWEKVESDYKTEVKTFIAERRECLQAIINGEKEWAFRSRARRERERTILCVSIPKANRVEEQCYSTDGEKT
jgi:hypothetical protein